MEFVTPVVLLSGNVKSVENFMINLVIGFILGFSCCAGIIFGILWYSSGMGYNK